MLRWLDSRYDLEDCAIPCWVIAVEDDDSQVQGDYGENDQTSMKLEEVCGLERGLAGFLC